MKVLFDLNVVLDLFLNRDPWVEDARVLVTRVLAGELEGYVSAAAVPTLFYIARKSVGSDQAFLVVRRCLDTFEVALIGRTVVERAAAMSGRDFEDNVQVAAAIEAGLDVI